MITYQISILEKNNFQRHMIKSFNDIKNALDTFNKLNFIGKEFLNKLGIKEDKVKISIDKLKWFRNKNTEFSESEIDVEFKNIKIKIIDAV